MGFNNDGAEVVAARLEQAVARRPGAGARRQHRQDARWCPRTRRSATTRSPPACSRRTPTTSWSTSARPTPPACATCRPSRSSSRCSSRRSQTTRPRRDRRVPLLVKIAPDLSDDDVLAVADLALAIGLDGIIATNTTISRAGLRTPDADGRGDRRRRAVRPAADRPLARRAAAAPRPGRPRPDPDRRRRDHHGRGRPGPPRRRRHPAAGLHRVHLRGPAVAAPDRPGRPERHASTVQVTGEVLDSKKVGAYRHLTVVASGVAERFRPGIFVAVALADSAHLARRSYWIHRVRPVGGVRRRPRAGRRADRHRRSLAGRPRAGQQARADRPAGPSVRAAQGAGELPARG